AEQVVEVAVVPLHRVGGPSALQAAGDRVAALAAAKSVPPAETLLLEAGALGVGTAILSRIGSTRGVAEGVAACNQSTGLLVIHGHAAERFLDVLGCSERIRFTVWPLRIYIDQAHLNGAERIFKHPIAGVTLVCKPLTLRPPVNIHWWLPAV